VSLECMKILWPSEISQLLCEATKLFKGRVMVSRRIFAFNDWQVEGHPDQDGKFVYFDAYASVQLQIFEIEFPLQL